MSIPKVIHYCWFGGNPKSELINKCIESWKKYAPDFQIIEWNEDNYDVNKYIYTKQAYEKKKYAFVSDVARFDILYKEGGIYLDTDVELLKPIDFLLEEKVFFGYDQQKKIASGLIMGCLAGQSIIRDIIDYYSGNSFLLPNGVANTTTVVTIVSDVLVFHGFTIDGSYYKDEIITMYPAEYFDPYNIITKTMEITDKTVSIHHYAASWKSDRDMKIYAIGRFIKKILGETLYDKIARMKHKLLG